MTSWFLHQELGHTLTGVSFCHKTLFFTSLEFLTLGLKSQVSLSILQDHKQCMPNAVLPHLDRASCYNNVFHYPKAVEWQRRSLIVILHQYCLD